MECEGIAMGAPVWAQSVSSDSEAKLPRVNSVQFYRYVNVYETFCGDEYDRSGSRQRQYSVEEISSIVAELRHYKSFDMEVHPDTYISRRDVPPRAPRRGIVNILSATTIFSEDIANAMTGVKTC